MNYYERYRLTAIALANHPKNIATNNSVLRRPKRKNGVTGKSGISPKNSRKEGVMYINPAVAIAHPNTAPIIA